MDARQKGLRVMKHHGLLDLFPKWEMSVWDNGTMLAYAYSLDGLHWRCRSQEEKYNPRSSKFVGAPPKIEVYSKSNATDWLRKFIAAERCM